jgi:hypothetical protein
MKKIEVKKAGVDMFDAEELACKVLGIDYDEIDADTYIIGQELDSEFDITLEAFRDIVSKLLPLIDVRESPVTKVRYKGFSSDGAWLVKMPISK